MKQIAVEKGLSTLTDYLQGQGYDVHEFDAAQKNSKDFLEGFDAVVLTGMSKNFMGMATTSTSAPIIDATGLTPIEIKHAIENKS